MQILADEWIGTLMCLDIVAEWKGAPHRFMRRGGEERRQPCGPSDKLSHWSPQIWERLPPTVENLRVRSSQCRLPNGEILAGVFSTGLIVAIQAEPADHAVQVAGQFGQVLEGFHSFFCALRILH